MEHYHDEIIRHRDHAYDIDPLIANRWSPRAMTGEPLAEEEFMPLFEAARWAPSSFNEQPWRFLYAKRETDAWETFFDLLAEANQAWCENAALLVVVLSKRTFTKNGKPNRNHSSDAGAAWENLALEATARGLVAHGMAGFDEERARDVLDVPDDFRVEFMVALGKRASKDVLPEDKQEAEQPNSRKELGEIVREGDFGF